MFEWIDLQEQGPYLPVIGALLRFSSDDITQAVLPCTATASWVPVKSWLDPKIDNTIF